MVSLGCSAEAGPVSVSVMLLAAGIPAPSNAAAKIVSIGSKDAQISMSWVDNSETETEFRIQRRLGWGIWSQVQVASAFSGGTASVSDVATSSGKYEYKVQACNTLGCSADSNMASVVVAANIATPSNAAAKIVSIGSKDAQISMSWADNSENE